VAGDGFIFVERDFPIFEKKLFKNHFTLDPTLFWRWRVNPILI